MISKQLSDSILSIICSYYNVSVEELLSRRRYPSTSHVRNVSCLILKDVFSLRAREIGMILKKDRTTTYHMIRRINKDMKNEIIKKDVNNLINAIKQEI